MTGARRRSLLFLALLAPGALWAGALTVPHVFSNGAVADAEDVNANFAAVEQAVDDNAGRLGTLESRLARGAALPATGVSGDLFATTDGRLFLHTGQNWKAVRLSGVGGTRPTGVTGADVLNYLSLDGSLADTGTLGSGTTLVGAFAYASGVFDTAGTNFGVNNAVALSRVAFSGRTATGLTFAAWVKGTNTAASAGSYRVANNIFGDTNSVVWLGAGVSGGKAAIKGQDTEIKSSAGVADNAWHHLVFALSYAGGTWSAQLYVDGVADGSGTLPVSGNPNYGIDAVGRTYTGYVQSHGYAIDEVFVFAKTLSAAQVLELYRAGL